MSRLSVDLDRLYASLTTLGEIGAYQDTRTGLSGVSRLALTAADGAGRRHVVEQMKSLGLSVSVDRIGNVFARREGLRPELSPVMMGSHIDSVETAGRFDGCLGVLGGLEVIATLNDHGVRTARPVLVAFFTDEEGSRFGTDMLGSAVATGRLSLDEAYALRDKRGLVLRDELESIGFLGDACERMAPPHVYLECHIEQGPVLASRAVELGVVTGVQAISWHELTIVGKSAHAGTTPMGLRADPAVAAARIALFMREMATRVATAMACERRWARSSRDPGWSTSCPPRWCARWIFETRMTLICGAPRRISSGTTPKSRNSKA